MRVFKSLALLLSICLIGCFIHIESFAKSEWVVKDGEWYYEDDVLAPPRWVKEYGFWYYVDESSKMVVGNKYINGKSYQFNDKVNDLSLPYGALIEEEPLVVEEKSLDNISYLEIEREGNECDSIVILLHGLGGKKEEYIHYGTELASKGLLVLIPDAYAHGGTSGSGDFADIISKSTKNLDKLLSQYNLGDKELSIIGCSMGGMIGANYICTGTYGVDNYVSLISSLDFEGLSDPIFSDIYENGKQVGKTDEEVLYSKLKEMSPLNNLDKFAGVRVYALNTYTDPYMDYSMVYNALEKLSKITDLKFDSLTTEGHKVTPQNFTSAFDFIMED